jgi:hypothetical protein
MSVFICDFLTHTMTIFPFATMFTITDRWSLLRKPSTQNFANICKLYAQCFRMSNIYENFNISQISIKTYLVNIFTMTMFPFVTMFTITDRSFIFIFTFLVWSHTFLWYICTGNSYNYLHNNNKFPYSNRLVSVPISFKRQQLPIALPFTLRSFYISYKFMCNVLS